MEPKWLLQMATAELVTGPQQNPQEQLGRDTTTSTSKVNWANSQCEHSAKSAACGPTRLPKDLAPILNATNVTERYGSKAPPQ